MFRALTQYPSLDRLLALRVPTRSLSLETGIHDAQPCPNPRVASRTDNHVSVVVIDGAAHAINFSHPVSWPT
jgi:hypothetical protein